ncbi:hypothetical protein [Desulfobacter curvatus]|uniref:hypothetical protein n=1 Tax=Desulfobacter curvatus TaxID=2290 RepID=UPI00035FC73F|nr:hypothetical protein [Desulfobacter curvatus]
MIDSDIKEALGELINISYGSATAAIADLFDSFAQLKVPGIQIISVGDVEHAVLGKINHEPDLYITTQMFKGTFEGEILFVIDKQSAYNIQNLICLLEEVCTDQEEDDSETRQSILEIANILGASCIGKLAELLDSVVSFLPPSIELNNQLLMGREKAGYSKVLIISTVLEFEEEQITGHLFILFDDEMFVWLEKSLYAFIEENT